MHAPAQGRRHRRAIGGAAAATALVLTGLVAPPGAVAADTGTVPYTVMFNNFESSVGSRAPAWSALDVAGPSGTPAATSFSTTDVRTRVSHARSLRVAARDHVGDGAQMPIPATLLTAGQTYTISVWVHVAEGSTPVTAGTPLTARVAVGGTALPAAAGTDLVLEPGVWKRVAVTYTHTAGATPLTVSIDNTTGTFYLDDAMVSGQRVGDPVPATGTLKNTLGYPVGVAVERRSTLVGTEPEQVLSAQFDQVTPENAMKPESWYGADGKFAGSPGAEMTSNEGADALMDWAKRNDGRVYGHVLVWHGQNPGWFFQDGNGQPLDAAALSARMRTHIFDVAEYLADRYGPFGSPGNPLAAFDVVNEVIADSASTASNGMRTSTWFNTLGEQFVDQAFRDADEAFNDVYAAPGSDRPVKLFINDYGTEGGDAAGSKLNRYYDLVQRLIARDVPIDGVGHQYHVNLNTPTANLRTGLEKFTATGLQLAVTEFDVTTGYPQTERLAIRQGQYYRTAFDIFNAYDRANPDRLFSVTVWGLNDAGSWLYYDGAPLMFDDYLNPKWSLVGALGGDVPAEPKAMTVFGGEVDLDAPRVTSDPQWQLVAPAAVGDHARFALRWSPDTLTAYVDVTDASVEATDAVTFRVGAQRYTFARSGEGDVPGAVTQRADGWTAVVQLPLTGAAEGGTVPFDVAVTDGATTAGWNAPGILGELTLREPLSHVDVLQVDAPPAVDAEVDDLWAAAPVVRTDKVTQGTAAAAYADVRTVWSGDGSSFFLLAEVTDPQVSLAPNNAWEKDSLEIFVDPGNAKNGAYRADDVQIRIAADNAVSSGAGRVVASATRQTDTGYVVEAEISLLAAGGPGTLHGLDFQVNDATGNARTGVKAWADPTGQGYQNTARWGVARLAERRTPALALGSDEVRAGGDVTVTATGFPARATVELQLVAATSGAARAAADPVALGTVEVAADGVAETTVTVPASVAAGDYRVAAVSADETLATADLRVVAAAVEPTPEPTPDPTGSPTPGATPAPGGTGSAGGTGGTGSTPGRLATTGSAIALWSALAAALLAGGGVLVRARRAAGADD
ncbi:endo-1,4-beta-xylanase [Cellulomonas iranensis]|uniref:endo-1,4-beta-xylanase n=1 Tax=Cellulomonas iranensis TaxID=76862 RepID=UPI000B3C7BD5|nr:endo-1,4-beta-xylanase [Cellulomonas iranensis]